jgi:death-on-curing protein
MAGVRDHAALAACLAQPQMMVFGFERFSSPAAKAAAYCFFIARNHPFVDGNKRTGFLAALHFLLVNGVVPHFNEERTYNAITAVVAEHLDVDGLSEFVQESIDG